MLQFQFEAQLGDIDLISNEYDIAKIIEKNWHLSLLEKRKNLNIVRP
jgi:hypothetical protein